MLISIICCMPYIKGWNRIMARVERDELEGARDRYKRLLRNFNLLTIPVSIFILSVPETCLAVFFGKTDKNEGYLLMIGAVVIYCTCFAIFFSWLINHMGKSMVTILELSVGWAVHVAFLILFVAVLDLGLIGLMLSVLVAVAIYAILGFLMLGRMLRYKKEYIRTYLIPVVSSAASGLVVFFLNSLLINRIGEILTFLLCAVVFWFVYMILMIVLRDIKTDELYKIPLGGVFIGFSKSIGRGNYGED